MNKDKIILRFTVRMMDTDTHKHSHTDLQRRFVLSYFMMDDTIQVWLLLLPRSMKSMWFRGLRVCSHACSCRMSQADSITFLVNIFNTQDCDLSIALALCSFQQSAINSFSLQVFEPPIRNSGIAGGKFLERQPVYKPNSEDVYTYSGLYVGATMEIFNRTFELFEADEYTYTYMENNKHVFIMADHEVLLKSLRAQVRETCYRSERGVTSNQISSNLSSS